MRIPLAVNLESRNGDLNKDSKMLNALAEPKSQDDFRARSRPGSTSAGVVEATPTRPRLLAVFLGRIITAYADTGAASISGETGTIAAGAFSSLSTFAIPVTNTVGATEQMSWAVNASGSAARLFFFRPNIVSGDRPAWLGPAYTILGTLGGTAFWFTSGYTPVPGAVYLDGFYYIMDTNSRIWNSNLDDLTTWASTGLITANQFGGQPVALSRSQNYVVAFKEYTTEFFYNAGNATGSPLSPVPNAFTQVGCAQGFSIQDIEGAVFWISRSEAAGRGVHMMRGIDQAKVSTPDIDRVLNACDLTTVYSGSINLDGHRLYIVSIVNEDLTLAYDLDSKRWYEWSIYAAAANVNVTSITRDGTLVTVTCAAPHGLVDGDPATIAGATQTEYNGLQQVNVVSPTVFTYEIATTPATPATGTITVTPYTETYYKYVFMTGYQDYNVALHVSDGEMYLIDPSVHLDDGNPINFLTRSQRLDGGSLDYKRMSRATLISDRIASTAMIRYSDDDAQTWSNYRQVDLSIAEPMVRRLGAFRRRQMEVRHVKNALVDMQAIEMEIA